MKALNRDASRIMDKLTKGVDLDHPKTLDNGGPGIMAVHVEQIGQCKAGNIFSVAHYYEQNGDLMRDPDMEFLKAADGRYYPISFRNDGLEILSESVEFDDDGEPVTFRPHMQKDQAAFAATWMMNIRMQQKI